MRPRQRASMEGALPRKSTLGSSLEPRPSVTDLVIAEVASFHDVFGYLGIPMIVVFVLSAVWTFTLAYIQVHATEMANSVMNTTNFDNGEFWLLPHPEDSIVISSAVMLSLFGIGYTALVVMMLLFSRVRHKEKITNGTVNSAPGVDSGANAVAEPSACKATKFYAFIEWMSHKCSMPQDIRDHYFVSTAPLMRI
ncbi:unnamed protein product [Phytophthora lilii]|uniref:Unnamed protein product n=1 Tax=Phytophthora lilii TaxID=2077276 RepID=A0A9W6XNZ3_9STRA|nr:unnamed protein product [Phytophthora lilii]